MNRLIVALLSVLIVLVAVNGFLVWRAGERAEDEAERQSCIARAEANTIVAIVAPGFVTAAEDRNLDAQIESLRQISTELDAC
jgi:hypothetical protein